jgi:hypothetical protein
MSLFILDAIGLDVLTMVKPVSAVPGSTQKAKVPPEGEAQCLKRLVGLCQLTTRFDHRRAAIAVRRPY